VWEIKLSEISWKSGTLRYQNIIKVSVFLHLRMCVKFSNERDTVSPISPICASRCGGDTFRNPRHVNAGQAIPTHSNTRKVTPVSTNQHFHMILNSQMCKLIKIIPFYLKFHILSKKNRKLFDIGNSRVCIWIRLCIKMCYQREFCGIRMQMRSCHIYGNTRQVNPHSGNDFKTPKL
jgi:hypothetical protein